MKDLDIRCTKETIQNFFKILKEDQGYYISWQANLAMTFKDEVRWYKESKRIENLSEEDIHKIANAASIKFLDRLIS